MITIEKLREGVLNKEVLAELEQNRELRILWCLAAYGGGVLDWEIDPLHQPEWCAQRIKREAEILRNIKRDLATVF